MDFASFAARTRQADVVEVDAVSRELQEDGPFGGKIRNLVLILSDQRRFRFIISGSAGIDRNVLLVEVERIPGIPSCAVVRLDVIPTASKERGVLVTIRSQSVITPVRIGKVMSEPETGVGDVDL